MTAPALNASISIKDKVNGIPNGHSHTVNPAKVKTNGVHAVNGINGHSSHYGHASPTGSIVKEAPLNTGRGRPLRVVCIGAGAAGIYLGLKLPRTISPELCELQVRCVPRAPLVSVGLAPKLTWLCIFGPTRVDLRKESQVRRMLV